MTDFPRPRSLLQASWLHCEALSRAQFLGGNPVHSEGGVGEDGVVPISLPRLVEDLKGLA